MTLHITDHEKEQQKKIIKEIEDYPYKFGKQV
jgi:hypothetical protein